MVRYIWRKARRLLLGVGFLAMLSGAVMADTTVSLNPDQLRAAAIEELHAGAPNRAIAYADALIARDANDRLAHLIRARGLRDVGRYDEALASGRMAWTLSKTDAHRYSSAMVLAQIQSSAGHHTYSQIWLRRAIHRAPNDELEQRAIRDFKYVRSRNPWSTRISFAITPDSNINNGSSSRSSFLNYRLTEVLFGEPIEYELIGTARALSGIEYSFGLNTRYRFSESATDANDLFFSVDIREYTLSSDAKSIAPDAKSSDFSFASYFVGYGHRGFNFSNRGEYAFRTDIGQSWYGGEEYARFIRANIIQSYALTRRTRLNARLSGERQIGVTTNDLDTGKIDLWFAHILPSRSQVRLFATGAIGNSPAKTQEFTELALRGSLALAKQWAGAYVQLGLGYRQRDYGTSGHSAKGRHDQRVGAEMTLIFANVDYYGFNPTMTFYAQYTDSNIELYKSKRMGINIGIQSAF
jgi:tetratricopeptide (TPR) repeat protein